jgi:hypothetical protein
MSIKELAASSLIYNLVQNDLVVLQHYSPTDLKCVRIVLLNVNYLALYKLCYVIVLLSLAYTKDRSLRRSSRSSCLSENDNSRRLVLDVSVLTAFCHDPKA